MEQQVNSFQSQLAQKDADLEEKLAKQAKEAGQKLQETRDLDRQMAAETLAATKQVKQTKISITQALVFYLVAY